MFLNFQDAFKYKSVISIERKYNIIGLIENEGYVFNVS